VLWHVNHFGFSNPSGKWMAEGTLVLDTAKPENSKVNATIHVATLTTGLTDLDEHLKSPLFFDATKFPEATFVSNKVVVTGKTTATVSGMLTLHGVTKPVTLNVILNKTGVNEITNKNSVGFSATAKINRSDFGINTLLPGVSDEIVLDIQSEAFK
jgi:polyisoprenoid-binding protein YceI